MLFFLNNPYIPFSQSFTFSEEVIISNSLIYEKNRIEANAINNQSSSSVNTRSSTEQSSTGRSSSLRRTEVSSNCNFIKNKPSNFRYIVKENGKLYIEVTVYGKCRDLKSLFDVDVRVINLNKEEYVKSGSAYILKVGNKIASKIKSDTNLYLSIFYEDGNDGRVVLLSPYRPSLNNYNEELRANKEEFFNLSGESWDMENPSALSKIYYVFSVNKFTYDAENPYSPNFSREEFFNIMFKWKKSEKFLVREIPLIIEK